MYCDFRWLMNDDELFLCFIQCSIIYARYNNRNLLNFCNFRVCLMKIRAVSNVSTWQTVEWLTKRIARYEFNKHAFCFCVSSSVALAFIFTIHKYFHIWSNRFIISELVNVEPVLSSHHNCSTLMSLECESFLQRKKYYVQMIASSVDFFDHIFITED